jgi:hypothetical protein
MKCLDGPAMGKDFLVRRCPIFLRVVERPDESTLPGLDPNAAAWDVLDQLEDEVDRVETVHVYARVAGTWSRAMIDGPKIRGCYEFGEYRHVPTMPEEEAELRDNDRWARWVQRKGPELGTGDDGLRP